MKKIVTGAVVLTAAIATLSGCKVDTSTNLSSASHEYATSNTSTETQSAQAPAAPAKPKYTVAEENAIESAQSYLDMQGFSRAGLIEQLTSKAGEGFHQADAVFAVNHIKVDWNKEAVEAAKSYLDMGGFSRASLIEQLSSKSGEQFTLAQARYAANHVGLR